VQTRLTKIKAKPGISFDLLNVSLICYQVFFFAEMTVPSKLKLGLRRSFHGLEMLFLFVHFYELMKIHKEEDVLTTKIPGYLVKVILLISFINIFVDIY